VESVGGFQSWAKTDAGHYRLFRNFKIEGAIIFLDLSKAFDSLE
jgi:hypothetical protein